MRKTMYLAAFCCAMLVWAGCSAVSEPFRVVWGSSTRALEKARKDSVKKTFHCVPDQCFDQLIAAVERNQKQTKLLPETRNASALLLSNKRTEIFENTTIGLQIFLKDRQRRLIVLMGIPGSIDTTEAGIFLTALSPDVTEIEISSLSRQARDTTAQILFPQLEQLFGTTPSDDPGHSQGDSSPL